MNRTRPRWALVAAMAAGGLLLGAAGAGAQANYPDNPADPWRNQGGVSATVNAAGEVAARGVQTGRIASMDLNPEHIGQWLWGAYYDVREVPTAGGGSASQNVNIQIQNTTRDNTNPPAGLPRLGGVIARVRFYESRTSREVLDFDIVLSCGDIWTGVIKLDGDTPRIESEDLYAPGSLNSNSGTPLFVTRPFPGFDFSKPDALTFEDIQRGYFSVTAMETLPCKPVEGKVDPVNGNTWARIPDTGDRGNVATPLDTLAAQVVLIRVGAGVSHFYQADAVSRFVGDTFGSIFSPLSTGQPTVQNCRFGLNQSPASCGGQDCSIANQPQPYTGVGCVDQMNFALSKARLMPQYDIDERIGATTRLVVTLPTKRDICRVAGADYNGTRAPWVAGQPFTCDGAWTCQGGAGNGSVCTPGLPPNADACFIGGGQCLPGPTRGEPIDIIGYNRAEDWANLCDGGGQCNVSPCPPKGPGCRLPREVSILGVEAGDIPTSQVIGDVVDLAIDVEKIKNGHRAGWLDITFPGKQRLTCDNKLPGQCLDPAIQEALHTPEFNFLGVGYKGYDGYPALALVLQEYYNGELQPVGVFGGTLPPPYEVSYHAELCS